MRRNPEIEQSEKREPRETTGQRHGYGRGQALRVRLDGAIGVERAHGQDRRRPCQQFAERIPRTSFN